MKCFRCLLYSFNWCKFLFRGGWSISSQWKSDLTEHKRVLGLTIQTNISSVHLHSSIWMISLRKTNTTHSSGSPHKTTKISYKALGLNRTSATMYHLMESYPHHILPLVRYKQKIAEFCWVLFEKLNMTRITKIHIFCSPHQNKQTNNVNNIKIFKDRKCVSHT